MSCLMQEKLLKTKSVKLNNKQIFGILTNDILVNIAATFILFWVVTYPFSVLI